MHQNLFSRRLRACHGRVRLQDKLAYDESFDVNDLRKYRNMVWNQVAPAGNLNYVTVSFVANMAIQSYSNVEASGIRLAYNFPSLKNINQAHARLYKCIGCWTIAPWITSIMSTTRCSITPGTLFNNLWSSWSWRPIHRFGDFSPIFVRSLTNYRLPSYHTNQRYHDIDRQFGNETIAGPTYVRLIPVFYIKILKDGVS